VKDVRLAYGRDGLVARVPDGAEVVAPVAVAGLPDEHGAVVGAVSAPLSGPPLEDLVARARRAAARRGATGGPRVAIVFPDITRPMPNRTVLPPLLGELERCGVAPDRLELLCATGTHRAATAEEMAELVGPHVVRRHRIHQHDAHDGDHVEVGRVDGTPVLLERRYVEADLRVLTGFVEPHFFAGFSGGPKGACPGLAALATVLEAHSPARIAHPEATWLTTRGNPVHDFVRAAVDLAPPALSLDVAINDDRALTAVFAGPLPEAHDAACRYVEATAVRQVAAPFDVVLGTNGGYPLDRNLYQAVKGMAAAARVVRPGGTIVMAAACEDGTPGDGAFARLLQAATDSDAMARGPRHPETDAWQVQVLGRVLGRAAVWLYSQGLDDDEVRTARLHPVGDVSGAVASALEVAGPGARLGVLPFGPLTVATVAAAAG